MNTLQPFQSLRNPVFARLYTAQTTSLLGDTLTWVGLALLAFELAGKHSGIVLSITLTLRVTTFVLLSPLAGVIADRFDRKRIMVLTHLVRMLIVGFLPIVTQVWQIYVLIFTLNVFNAFFTPTYQATIPLVTRQDDYPQAIALSSATYQLLGVLGPSLAGSLAVFIGARQLFFLDALSFLVAAVMIFTLPTQLRVDQSQQTKTTGKIWQDIKDGTTRLFTNLPIRYALAMQLVASVAGAQILVNTVGYIQGTLKLGNQEYGWVMAAFGIGATLSSIAFGAFNQRLERTSFAVMGATIITTAMLPANYASLAPLMILWSIAGVGQTLVNLSTQTLIADQIPVMVQGRVYGAHFAWSHLWWVISYPLAGWLGSHFPQYEFLSGGCIGLLLLVVIQLTLVPRQQEHESFWHEHEHTHNYGDHDHTHEVGMVVSEPHSHAHQHQRIDC